MSALTNFKGELPWLYDQLNQSSGAPSLLSSAVMDATAEKIAIIGCVWHPTVKTGTINIRKVHFRTGAITFNVLSTVRVSLQNVSATAGPPQQPDGSQDQTYDYALGVGLTANAWNTTGNLSADRAVDLSAVSFTDTNSRWIAIVFEFTTFTALDSVVISGLNYGATLNANYLGNALLLNTGAWALPNTSGGPIAALECDDGTYAFLDAVPSFSAFSSASVASNGAIRAAGLKFSLPVETKIEGFDLLVLIANGCDGTLVIYDSDGTTALVTVAIDNDAIVSVSAARYSRIRFPPITLAANTAYRAVFVAGTTTAATVYYGDVNAAGLMDAMAGGQDFHWTERDSAGTWADTTTRRPHFGIKIGAVHDGSGGAGGLVRHPGMNGGLNG